MHDRLRGRAVLVTGAARGIGCALARRLAAAGARLALVGLEPHRLEALARELGHGHAWAECDVTDGDSLARAVAHGAATLGRLDVVVANAGIAAFGAFSTTPIDAMVRMAEVNYAGVLRTVSATLPHVVATRGYYLLVASAASFAPAPGLAAYAGTKSAVEQFGRTLGYEVRHHGVDVGTAHPIWIDTDMVRDAGAEIAEFDRMRRRLPPPLSRLVTPEVCADALVRAITRRARRVYVPRSLAPFAWARHLLATPPFDALTRSLASEFVPVFERESTARTSPFGAHSVERDRDAWRAGNIRRDLT
jgi:NAD(P)-dependent dehydrogenase (short-subunit alcohol dehydrogenase family)